MCSSELKHWLPHKLWGSGDELLCKWFYGGEKRFTEPFFDETIQKCLSHPLNSKRFKCVSHLDLLPPWALELEQIRPTAFIFHVSRCGSTLLSQLLSVSPQNIVLSEVPFLDELLRLPYQNRNVSLSNSDRLFGAALAFYSQKRNEAERHLFVKTDSWHILFYHRLRQLHPDIPFVLLYREPGAILHSHQRIRGMHAVPGLIEAELFGWDREGLAGLGLDHYLAKVLESYYAAYLEVIRDDSNLVVANHNEGMLNILKRIEHKTSIGFTTEEWQKAAERSGFDAKHPGNRYAEPGLSPADDECLQRCFTLYRQIEDYRCGTGVQGLP
jgi:hypothetical protein